MIVVVILKVDEIRVSFLRYKRYLGFRLVAGDVSYGSDSIVFNNSHLAHHNEVQTRG